MKVYLAVPLVANRALDRAALMAKAIQESGHVLTSPWVLGALEAPTPAKVNVFDRDLAGAQDCDVLVADVSSPSTGVGMEVMAAHLAGKRIVLAWKRGATVSHMLRHMKGKEVVEFEDEGELVRGLLSALGRREPI